MTRILIAEDDHPLRKNIKALLEGSGYNVLEAGNGLEALQLIESEVPDLILSDVLMPQVNGFELLEKLKEKALYPKLPLIFMSARTELADIREGMNKGADDYILKPFKAKDLLEAIKTKIEKNLLFNKSLNSFRYQIATNFSHELRTPLTPILGYSQFLKECHSELKDEEIEETCTKIQVSGNRMLRLVNKLLLLVETLCITNDEKKIRSLREAGKVNAGDTISTTIFLIASRFSRTRDLSVDIKDANVRITDYYLEILIGELAENAFKFSPEGSTVIISTEIDNDIYKLNISNQGCGFTRQDIENHSTFDQFDRDASSTSGLGIGLTLIKKIVEIFEGKFEIETEYKKYTDIKISLPLVSN